MTSQTNKNQSFSICSQTQTASTAVERPVALYGLNRCALPMARGRFDEGGWNGNKTLYIQSRLHSHSWAVHLGCHDLADQPIEMPAAFCHVVLRADIPRILLAVGF